MMERAGDEEAGVQQAAMLAMARLAGAAGGVLLASRLASALPLTNSWRVRRGAILGIIQVLLFPVRKTLAWLA